MGKNIVICCDGTGNEFGESNSNVVKLYQTLVRDAEQQVTYYHPGVGTMGAKNALSELSKWWTKVRGLAFGYGLSDNIADAYEFLIYNYQPGDKIYIFGFSRGAYTARALCGFLQFLGLLHSGNEGHIPYAIRLFKGGAKNFHTADRFRATFCIDCKPYFVGLWDTVSSVGWILDPIGLKNGSLPGTFTLKDVSVIRHAVSIDERRAFFRQNLVKPCSNLKEVWFAGVHSDVGGSYPEGEAGLSKITLRWMLREAHEQGLLLDGKKVDDILGDDPSFVQPRWNATQHNSLTAAWWIGEFWPKRKMQRVPTPPCDPPMPLKDGQSVADRDQKQKFKAIVRPNLFQRRKMLPGSCIHDSVRQRLDNMPDYRPENLLAVLDTCTAEPEPDAYQAYPLRIQVGQKIVVGIHARPKWNDTTVSVRAGETYRLSATGKWFDASIKSGPEGYKSQRVEGRKKLLFTLTERFRRVPSANWFALVITINQDLSTAVVPVAAEGTPPYVLKIAQDGILYGFANDLSWFYGNNDGNVLLTVERLG